MLLKNPELLWALGLLIFPVIIHLLRFRRFRKTPFTNVRILQQVLQKSNQGNRLKKWLILICRIGFLSALVLAFTQPYLADSSGIKPKEIVIYLDNSFSMQAAEKGTNLLEKAAQGLLQEMPDDFQFAILTNDERYAIKSLDGHRETLLNLKFSSKQADYESLLIRAKSELSKSEGFTRELWLISDFKEEIAPLKDQSHFDEIHTVILRPERAQNISLDTAFVLQREGDFLELKVEVTLDDTTRIAPISIFDGEKLIAQSIPVISGTHSAEMVFSLPSETPISGVIRVTDQGLTYDNNLYYNFISPPKIKVYAIGERPESFLNRIFTSDEFVFTQSPLPDLDYGLLPNQNLIVLNELTKIPDALIAELELFHKSGGTLLVIPSGTADRSSYNKLLNQLSDLGIGDKITNPEPITEVAFENSLFAGVFEGTIENFDYPIANLYYPIGTSRPNILTFQNGLPFLAYSNNVYLLASGLTQENSDFAASPLIVPTFYKIAQNSLAYPQPYYTVGRSNTLDLDIELSGEEIIRLKNDSYAFIPQQRRYSERVTLQFGEEPQVDGNYEILQKNRALGKLGFNYDRKESRPGYPEFVIPNGMQIHETLSELLESHRNKTSVHQLWKWFVNLALLFVLAEIALQKFWK